MPTYVGRTSGWSGRERAEDFRRTKNELNSLQVLPKHAHILQLSHLFVKSFLPSDRKPILRGSCLMDKMHGLKAKLTFFKQASISLWKHRNTHMRDHCKNSIPKIIIHLILKAGSHNPIFGPDFYSNSRKLLMGINISMN